LGGDRGQGPVYVRSTSDRVEVLCTACPIGETIIVFLTIERREVDQHVLNIPFVDHSGRGRRIGYLAAPAEPETLIVLKRLSQCDGHASSSPFTGGVGNRYAVRNNGEPR